MPKTTKHLKEKKCKAKGCNNTYVQYNSIVKWCSVECGLKLALEAKEKTIQAEKKAERRELRKRKINAKTWREWDKEAQQAFNRYIRFRDKDDPCISCGRYDWEIKDVFVGGKWDCGHWLTRGAHPELRFDESNAHKQCKSCNGGSGKYTKKNHTVKKQYDENIIKKIGQDEVDRLKGPHEIKKRTISDLKEIKAKYTRMAKELEDEL